MLRSTCLATAVGVMLLSASGLSAATERIIVLAPDYPLADAEQIADMLGRTVLAGLAPGDGLTVLEGASGRTIVDVRVPDEPIYATHRRQLARVLQPAWTQLQSHLTGAARRTEAEDRTRPGSQVDLPSVVQNLGYAAARAPDVLVIGNPLHHDETMPAISFRSGYPTAGHLALNRSTSPLGTDGLSLAGVNGIHFCVTSNSAFLNAVHEEGVQRYWSLYAEALDTRLLTYTPSFAECAKRFMAGEGSGARTFSASDADRVAMIDASVYSDLPPALQTEIASGITRFESLGVFDWDAEDGDVVEIIGTDFRQRVDLRNRPETVRVPITHGALRVVGIADGNRGITVGIKTADDRMIVSDTIAVGETVDIPLGNPRPPAF